MEDYDSIYKEINNEVTGDAPVIRQRFLDEFGGEVKDFVDKVSRAFLNFQKIEANVDGDKKGAHVAALVYSAINLHIVSMKLFLSGYPVAAGNLHRQVIETIALAILCSAKSLDVLDRYVQNKYSTNKAVRDVVRHAEQLHLKREGVRALEKGRKFYSEYSHPTLMTIANQISFQSQDLYLGASFDEAKLEEYEKEVRGRVSLADALINFVKGVEQNLSQW
jgi:hypothetical protein